jgi:hypothetical protein
MRDEKHESAKGRDRETGTKSDSRFDGDLAFFAFSRFVIA